MFASNTLSEHILRGTIGLGALWIAVAITEGHPWGSLALGAVVLSDLLDDRTVRNRGPAMA